MPKKPLSALADHELAEAHRCFRELVDKAGEQAAANPGPGWDPVFDMLEDAERGYQDELARRTQPPQVDQSDG